jgi:hypothetical protein
MSDGSLAGYSSTNLSELVSRMGPKMSTHLRKLLLTCGTSCKYGSRIHDSARTPIEILESGRNHMAVIMVLHLQRTSHDVVIFLTTLTVSVCRYFLQQNDAIRNGMVKGENINLKVLGIGDGLTVGHLESLTSRCVANDSN